MQWYMEKTIEHYTLYECDSIDHDHDEGGYEGRLWECIALITPRGSCPMPMPQDFACRVGLAFLIEIEN